MVDTVNILGLPVAVALDGSEYTAVVQGGTTKRAAVSLFDISGGSGGSVQDANTVLAGPTSGDAAAPSFRALVDADLPEAAQAVAFLRATASVDFNAANTDTSIAIVLPTGFTRYMINSVFVSGASASITTATAGLFTAADGGGTAIVTAASAITVSTASESTADNAQSMTVANATTISFTATTLYWRVATAQGSAATATVSIVYVPVS